MIDEREIVRRAAEALTPPEPSFDRLLDRRDRVQRNRRIQAGVLGIAVAIAVGWVGFSAIRSTPPPPADDRSEDLGIFAPVVDRIVFQNDIEGGDLGYEPGLWAIDPNGPSDTVEGRTVADDVASGLVRLGPDDMIPLAWSRDGTELLFMRSDRDQLFPEESLYVLHADGSETQVTTEPMYFGGATISPDGSRVAFAAWGDHLGLYVVDLNGGRPVRLPLPGAEGIVADPAFSPDGTRIAYVDSGESENHLWVMDADGGNAHEILADEAALTGGAGGLQWSPATDRLLAQGRLSDGTNVIYTFASDGSDFTQVITGGMSPYWSPDGSRIAYTIECELTDPSCLGAGSAGLAIADADGSNVRAFSFAASGPWHPGGSGNDEPVPTPVETPTPDEGGGPAPSAGGVLRFRGTSDAPGDLVAVDPATGEERVLAEDLDDVTNARWSADGRWVAFEMKGSLWVVGRRAEPRRVFEAPVGWSWSSTGARLAVFRGSMVSDHRLYVIDASTGQQTELASIVEDVVADVFSPEWSPDETRILFGVRGGAIYSVDVRTGERSLFVQLPGENLDSIDGMAFSQDGSRLAIYNDLTPGDGRLFVLNADGSDIAVLSDALVFGFDWSPDGSRIVWTEDHGGEFHVLVAPADGSTRSLVASLPNAPSNPVWSPDGSQIALGHGNAFLSEGAPNLVIDADGPGDAVPLDDLSYESWRGGSYDCDCDIFG